MALTDKLKAIADGFRTSRGTEQKYTLDEMAVLAAEDVGGSGGSGGSGGGFSFSFNANANGSVGVNGYANSERVVINKSAFSSSAVVEITT